MARDVTVVFTKEHAIQRGEASEMVYDVKSIHFNSYTVVLLCEGKRNHVYLNADVYTVDVEY